MVTSLKNSLLSLLLALKRLQVPLAKEERDALADISEQLMYASDARKIEPDLMKVIMKVIEGNPALQQLYQESLTRLERFNGQLPPNLLPNLAELEAELPSPSNEPTEYSHAKDLATEDTLELEPGDSLEIANVSLRVLANSQPEEAAKKVSGLQRLWEFLQRPIF